MKQPELDLRVSEFAPNRAAARSSLERSARRQVAALQKQQRVHKLLSIADRDGLGVIIDHAILGDASLKPRTYSGRVGPGPLAHQLALVEEDRYNHMH